MKIFWGIVCVFMFLYGDNPPEVVWSQVFDTQNEDLAYDIEIDEEGNIYVAGESGNEGNYDILIVKYDKNGSLKWSRVYATEYNERARGVTVDKEGGVYITGFCQKNTFLCEGLIIKYEGDGDIQWAKRYERAKFYRCTNKENHIYVTGEAGNSLLLLKYNENGDIELEKKIDLGGASAQGYDITPDTIGNIYIGGNFCPGYGVQFLTLKCDGTGDIKWKQSYSKDALNWGEGIGVDKEGNVYITGTSATTGSLFYNGELIKYDEEGKMLLEVSFEDSTAIHGIEIDNAGDIYTIGSLYNGNNKDIILAKLDNQGEVLWKALFDNNEDDIGYGVALDSEGYVIITGFSEKEGSYNFITIKYKQYFGIRGYVKDEEGNPISGVIMEIAGDTNLVDTTDAGGYYEFKNLPCARNYTLTPKKSHWQFEPPFREYSPLNYTRIEENFLGTQVGISEKKQEAMVKEVIFNPFEAPSIIHYYLNSPEFLSFKLYDIEGKLIDILYFNAEKSQEKILVRKYPGKIPAGIYFLEIRLLKSKILMKLVVF